MSQFRQNPLTGQWVSIAPRRAERPMDYAESLDGSPAEVCPFCEGNERDTPLETLALRSADAPPNGPGWQVRVVTNRYPFVSVDHTDDEANLAGDDLFATRSGAGLQEVIIESPQHLTEVTQLSATEWTDVLGVYRQRLEQIQADGRWKYALLFKNSGEQGGASLAHLHSQLVALPTVPAQVAAMWDRFRAHYEQYGRTLLVDIIQRELAAGERVVSEGEHFVALCPFASRQPYEMLVLPKRAIGNFAEATDMELPALAALLRDLIERLGKVYADVAFNWHFHSSPFDTISPEHYHWHVEIVPRVTKTAGYEWATGNAVNIVSPETAAEHLRQLATPGAGGTAQKR